MSKTELTIEQRREKLLFRAHIRTAVICPVCGATPGNKCIGTRGQSRRSLHRPRITAWRSQIGSSNKRTRMMKILETGPVTSRNLADELTMSIKVCSGYLSELFEIGVVTRKSIPTRNDFGPRTEYLYEIKK